MSSLITNDKNLILPNGLEQEIKNEKFKKLQDEALQIQRELFKERRDSKWRLEVTGNFVVFKPYVDSPYLAPEVNGLVIKRDIQIDPKSGETQGMEDQRFIKVGKVIEVGPEVKSIKPGMDILYIAGGERVLPISTNEFGEEEWCMIQGGNIIMYGFKDI